jgi:NAD(P)-dependent dehydrogenase (short-subunit alcohol dehydrogenase family)
MAEVAALGVQVAYHGADMSRPADIADMMSYASARFGRVDILVNNAGIQHVARVEAFPPERWDAIMAINLSSAFHATRLALPAMQAAGWGRIINVASVHGLVASAEKAAYVAAKHGVVGLTKVTALENATTGVTCNAICPGWVLTPAGAKTGGCQSRRAWASPMKRRRGDCWVKKNRRCSSPPRGAGCTRRIFLLSRSCQCAGSRLEHGWRLDGTVVKIPPIV